MRRFAIGFLLAEACGAALWWAVLLVWPESRASFLVRGAPDATLLAFGVADGLLFVAAAMAAAWGLCMRRAWAWPLLCVHAGAAAYAALYCWTLVALTGGDGWLGAAMMTPSLVIPGWLVGALRPNRGGG
jgi:hypothetical protein